jgi:hypothetical protein
MSSPAKNTVATAIPSPRCRDTVAMIGWPRKTRCRDPEGHMWWFGGCDRWTEPAA